jgi:hypothetical protein
MSSWGIPPTYPVAADPNLCQPSPSVNPHPLSTLTLCQLSPSVNPHPLSTLTLSFLYAFIDISSSFPNAFLDICLLPCLLCYFVSSYASVGHPTHKPNQTLDTRQRNTHEQ